MVSACRLVLVLVAMLVVAVLCQRDSPEMDVAFIYPPRHLKYLGKKTQGGHKKRKLPWRT